MRAARRARPTNRFAPEERLALAAAMAGGSLVPLNSTMIAVGLPAIADDLAVGPGVTAVLVTAYLVAMLLLQPLAGRLGDTVGTTRLLVVALCGFGGAALVAGVASSFPVLLGARVLQAVFGAALIPNLQAVIRAVVDESRRGRAFGIMGSGIGAGAAIGPIVAGLLVGAAGWRAIFLVNVPVVAGALLLVGRFPRNDAAGDAAGSELEAGPLRNRTFRAACVVQSTSNFSTYTALLVVPLVLSARDWSSGSIGAALSALTLGMLVLAPVGGSIGDRYGYPRPIVIGMVAASFACVVLTAGVRQPAALVVAMLLLGSAVGGSGASLQAIALGAVGPSAAGSAAGLLSSSRYVGSITASIVIAVVSIDSAARARPVLALTVIASLVAAGAGVNLMRRT